MLLRNFEKFVATKLTFILLRNKNILYFINYLKIFGP